MLGCDRDDDKLHASRKADRAHQEFASAFELGRAPRKAHVDGYENQGKR